MDPETMEAMLAESRYPVLYCSGKGQWFTIDKTENPQFRWMNDFHLTEAYRKLLASGSERTVEAAAQLIEAMKEEIGRRGLNPAFKGGKPPAEAQP